MTRLRSAAQRAPQTREQALALATRFAAIAADLGAIALRRSAAHAHIDATCDAEAIPLAAEQADIVKQLKPWWSTNIDQLTGGKRKSIELGGCLIGYRVNPPSIRFAGGKDDAAVDTLRANELDSLVRLGKASPDKPAILGFLQLAEDARPVWLETRDKLADLGFSVSQPEVFFVDVASRDEAAAAIVPSDDDVR